MELPDRLPEREPGVLVGGQARSLTSARGVFTVVAFAAPLAVGIYGVLALAWRWPGGWLAMLFGLATAACLLIAWRRIEAAASVQLEGRRAASTSDEPRYRDLFEQSPVAIWENDWSTVKQEVDRLRASGVEDIEAYLFDHWPEAKRLVDSTRIIDVNRAAIAMYRLESAAQVTDAYVLEVPEGEVEAFCRRVGAFSRGEGPIVLETVDTRFDNSIIHIRTTSDVPDAAKDDWRRVLHIVEDITEQWTAQRDLALSEQRYRELFEQSPVSIWVEDWSRVKPMVDNLRQIVGNEVGAYIEGHPDFVAKAYDAMEAIDINEAGWRLMGAKSKQELLDWTHKPLHDLDLPQMTQIVKGFAQGHSRVEIDDNKDFTLDDRGLVIRGISFIPPSFSDDWRRVIHVFADVTARHTAEQQVRESGQLLELAQHMTAHGHFVYDVEADRTIACSNELARIFGIQPQDYLVSQRDSLVFLHPDDREWVAAEFERTVASREPLDIEYRVLRADGSVRYVHELSQPLVDESGAMTNRRIGTLHDITERRESEEALRRARDEAEKANRTKSEFLANVSHELRTPLNAIIGFSDVLLDGIFGDIGNPRYREYIGDINESGRHLLELINDILDLSKAEAGRLELSEEEVVVDRLIRQSVRLVRDRAQRSGLEIALDLPSDLPVVVVDARKLRQVLLNLLSNAVKFTPAGGDIRVSAHRRDEGGLDIVVADTGIGMQTRDIERAFEVFGQVDSALARRFEGSGLGLPLASAIVELHGGDLQIDSRPEGGTRVTVRLPPERVMPEQRGREA